MKNRILNRRASVLILAVWTLLMLSVFAASVGFSVRNFIDSVRRFEIRNELRLIARSGIEKGIYMLSQDLEKNSFVDYLGEPWSSSELEFRDVHVGKGFFSVQHNATGQLVYGLVDEQGKINLNLIEDVQVLVRLLISVTSVGGEDALAIASAILDWKDLDEEVRSSGAESEFYKLMKPPYVTRNNIFIRLDELLFVRGVTYEIFDGIKPFLTIQTDGKINLNTAPKPVLIAVGFGSSLADKIVQFRAGIDQIERSSDDRYFADLGSMSDVLKLNIGFSEGEETVFGDLIASDQFTVASSLFQAASDARIVGRRERLLVEASIDKNGRILSWHELFQAL